MASITLERISKVYEGGIAAVRDLDLHVRDGELLVVVGASGSGKSTVLRVIAGLERVSAGRVWIGERDVTDVPPQQRDLAMVFQNYALYPHLTVRQNLGFALEMQKLPRAEIQRRVTHTAETLGLSQLLERKPAALSGGQRQRVALGRALVREPQAFLLDEPLSNLDARLRVHTRAELVRLHRQLGCTMVYVTHDQVEAMTMGQRIALLHEGRLQQLATPLELYDAPANRMVAAFIGSPPMNFFAGTLVRANDRLLFASPALRLPLPLASETADAAGAAQATGSSAHTRVHEPEDGAVVLGIRPEHLEPCSEDAADCCARVTLVEALGPESLVHGSVGDVDVAVRIADRCRLQPGDQLPLRVLRDHLHLFAADSGIRL